MRKYRYISMVLLAVMGLTSCNKWLDVNPKDKIVDESLFSDYRGFRNSLNGIYQEMVSPELYGRELSWGMASALGQDYSTEESGAVYKEVQKYNFENASVKNVTASIWTKAYNIIANCNKLIEEIEKRDSSFFPAGASEKDLILGEALAVRAMLHFDILRLFAPAPVTNDTGEYIPYRKNYSVTDEPKVTNTLALQYITEDLLRAKDLVAKNDTVVNRGMLLTNHDNRFINGYSAEGGLFFCSRGVRLNFVAITGLLARVYLYAGDKINAQKYSEFIYNQYAPKTGETRPWSFTSSSDVYPAKQEDSSVKLIEDLLFALYDNRLASKVADYQTSNYTSLYLNGLKDLFTQELDQDDYRGNLIISSSNKDTCVKWFDLGTTTANNQRQYKFVPMIRLSEIYYILSECYAANGFPEDAERVLKEVRFARDAKRVVTGAPSEEFTKALIWEARKEFLTEGQTFFMFKRLNRSVTLGNRVIPTSFVLPRPDSEDIY